MTGRAAEVTPGGEAVAVTGLRLELQRVTMLATGRAIARITEEEPGDGGAVVDGAAQHRGYLAGGASQGRRGADPSTRLASTGLSSLSRRGGYG